MVVRDLKNYIEKNTKLLRNLPFRDRKLIIDGCNLYYALYFYGKLDQAHGGDYDAFDNLLREFFKNLTECEIQPFVVLDGGTDHTDKTFEANKRYHQFKIRQAHNVSTDQVGSTLPLLTKNVFRQTLHKLKVPHVQCIEEATREIAALAKQWNCPVLSNNSDFYIYDLPAGVVPIRFFRWKDIRNDKRKNKYISSKHFIGEIFCASNNMNKDLLPLFACILGNDYVKLQSIPDLKWELHSTTGEDFAKIDGLLTWLSKFPEPDAAMDGLLQLIEDKKEKEVTREILLGAMQEYTEIISGSLAEFFRSRTVTPTVFTGALQALPSWTLKPLLEGKMCSFVIDILLLKRVFMTTQVEDFRLPSSSEMSRPIRQVLYGLLLLGEQQTEDKLVAAAKACSGTDKCYVTEYHRQGIILTSSKLEALGTKVKDGLHLETIWKEPHNLRLEVLLDTLGVSAIPIRGIPAHLQLQVFVTRYWLINAKPQPNQRHLWALLMGMVYGTFSNKPNKKTDPVFRLRKLHQRRSDLDHEVAHLYSQWQCCLQWSLCLNSFLNCPLPEPECSRLYHGTVVHHVVEELQEGTTTESLLAKGSSGEQLFKHLRKAVLSLLDEDEIRRICTGHEHRAGGKEQSGKSLMVDDLSRCFNDLMDEDSVDSEEDDVVNPKKKKAKDKTDMLERSYKIRTRHKTKARNAENPSKKFERRCFE